MNARTKRLMLGVMSILLIAMTSLSAHAEFITDKIVVNVHSERFDQGAVLKTLPSGSIVTILMNDGKYSRVRTNDNVTGWVETKYITNEKPAQLEYLELMAKTKALEAQLNSAEEKLSAQSSGETDGIDLTELAELRKRAADAGWMRVELKKARDLSSELEGKLNSIKKNSSSSEKELNKLAEQNKILEKRLAAALLVNEQQDTPVQKLQIEEPVAKQEPENQPLENNGTGISIGWFLGSIVVAIIVGLIAGMTWLDKRIRQRHGGFRIY